MAFFSFPYGWPWGISRRPSPSPRIRTDGRSYADVITKFSRLDGLPIFLTHGASLARFARWSSANNNNEFAVAFPRGGSLSTVSRSNWNLEVLVFVEGGKAEYPEKNPRSRVENQQQTQPTYDAGYRNRTRATLVGGERSPCSPIIITNNNIHVKGFKIVKTGKFVKNSVLI